MSHLGWVANALDRVAKAIDSHAAQAAIANRREAAWTAEEQRRWDSRADDRAIEREARQADIHVARQALEAFDHIRDVLSSLGDRVAHLESEAHYHPAHEERTADGSVVRADLAEQRECP